MKLLWSIWCCISATAFLSQGSVLATNTSCPTWFYYDNTTQQCQCGCGLSCVSDKDVEIRDGFCATSAGEEGQYYYGGCPFGRTVNNTNRVHSEMPSDPGLLDDVMCGPYNRKGLLCGECIDGYGPTADVLDLKCANCSKLSESYAIPLYLVIELLPITLLFILVALFNFNITSGPLLGYIVFCQVHLVTMKKAPFINEHLQSHALIPLQKFLIATSHFWSLQYVAPVVPPFCISEKLSEIDIQLLGLVPAIYPILLVICTFILIELHARDFKPVKIFLKPFSIILKRTNIKVVKRHAAIHAFASFIFLSNASVYAISGAVITTTSVHRQDSSFYKTSVFYDPLLERLNYRHFQFLAICVIPFICLTVVPSVFHIVYPTRIYGYLSRCISARKRLAITAFAEALQVCFKDGLNGTRDYRALAGLITLIPIVYIFTRVFILTQVGCSPAISDAINLIVTCCIVSYIQPCKSAIANISLSFNSFLLGALHVMQDWWFSRLLIQTEILNLVLILIPLMSNGLVCVWAAYKLIHCTSKHCGCAGSTILTNRVKKFCCRRRCGGYQELN